MSSKSAAYRITGIVRGRKVSRITFFAVVREKTFAIQAISYIKIPAEIKSARKHLRMLPDSRNFSSADDSRYTVIANNNQHNHHSTNLTSSFVTIPALLCKHVIKGTVRH